MLRQTLQCACLTIVLGLMLGCTGTDAGRDGESIDANADPVTAPTAGPTSVLDDQLKALDKARSVEETLKKEQADRDKAIEDAGG